MKRYRVTVNGNVYDVEVEEVRDEQPPATEQTEPAEPIGSRAADVTPKPGDGTHVKAPLTGTILSVDVAVGSSVKKGDVLVRLEALKMENEIQSPVGGTVGYVGVTEGQSVEAGTVLIVIR